jgi:ligand-binding sensor domain-containing protein
MGECGFPLILQCQGKIMKITLYLNDGEKWEPYVLQIKPGRIEHLGIFSGQSGKLFFWQEDKLKIYDRKAWSETVNLSEEFRTAALADFPKVAMQQGYTQEYKNKNQYSLLAGLEDRNGNIWLSTIQGIFQKKEKQNQWIRYANLNVMGMMMYEDRSGRLWFSDRQQVLFFDPKTNQSRLFDLFSHLPEDLIKIELDSLKAIYQDKQGKMIFLFDKGILTFLEKEAKWNFYGLDNFNFPCKPIPSPRMNLRTLFEDKQGRTWLISSLGIIVYE